MENQANIIDDENEFLDEQEFPKPSYFAKPKNVYDMSQQELIRFVEILKGRNRDLMLILYEKNEMCDEKDDIIQDLRNRIAEKKCQVEDLEKTIEETNKVVDELDQKIIKKNDLIIKLKKEITKNKGKK